MCASGEFLTLLGPSGSGKTTLADGFGRLYPPGPGQLANSATEEVIRKPPHLRNLGMVFQSYALFPHMTVAGNVGYPLRLRRMCPSPRGRRTGGAGPGHGATGRLMASGALTSCRAGKRQRVALARAIVFEPRILLMDEPLSALDKKLRDRMQIELRHLHEQLGMTTVYVTHDQREALTMSDRIAVVNFGRIMQLATPQQLYDQPENRFVADFIGDSTLLDVRRDGDALVAGGTTLKTSRPVPDGDSLSLMMRPERLHLLTGAAADDVNEFTATVSEVVYQGESFLLYAALDNGTEMAVRGAIRSGSFAALPKPGETVRLGLESADTVILADEEPQP